ncbi:hypothetical protein HN958_02795 [Candidatus Falkowbacteria bacterium]|jgi:hypothetical protein|nr:hypothetical protein [Candidatus Falkowbacteria bacterium]MBT7007407.1 hypothetical protein [Candidatus Falkowbacteria bacterium]
MTGLSVVIILMDNKDATIDFKEFLVNLLSRLSDREQEVITKRYQLTNDLEKKSTLKKIGDSYSITRERVRQIERDAIKKLVELKKEEAFSQPLSALATDLNSFISKKGGIVREDQLLNDYVKPNHDLEFLHPNAYIFVFDNLLDNLEKVHNHDNFQNSWKINDLNLQEVAELLKSVHNKVEETKKLQSKDEIVNLAKDLASEDFTSSLAKYLENHENVNLEDFIENYLHTSQTIEKNILDKWGLVHWETVKPKKLGDKIFLVFQKVNEPLHFRDIADKINQANFDHKNICAATVHNELIANDKYVLIGRGIYAIKDWGYSIGTVADIIERILTESEKPLSKSDIYEEVLRQRKVNKSTIYLTLINKDKFNKTAEGLFSLK